jgi:hypothetical protein
MENQLRRILRRHSRSLTDRLSEQLAHRSNSHYRELDRSILSARSRMLVEALVRSACDGPEQLGEYVNMVADGQLEEGFELEELQRALRILEVDAWRIVANESTLDSVASNLTALNVTMGYARDELARACQAHAYGVAAQRTRDLEAKEPSEDPERTASEAHSSADRG